MATRLSESNLFCPWIRNEKPGHLSGMKLAYKSSLETRNQDTFTTHEFTAWLVESEDNHRNNSRTDRLLKNERFHYHALTEVCKLNTAMWPRQQQQQQQQPSYTSGRLLFCEAPRKCNHIRLHWHQNIWNNKQFVTGRSIQCLWLSSYSVTNTDYLSQGSHLSRINIPS